VPVERPITAAAIACWLDACRSSDRPMVGLGSWPCGTARNRFERRGVGPAIDFRIKPFAPFDSCRTDPIEGSQRLWDNSCHVQRSKGVTQFIR
jgi:hypothetical protein